MDMTTFALRRINSHVLRSIFFTTTLLPRLSIMVSVCRTLAWLHHSTKRGDLGAINLIKIYLWRSINILHIPYMVMSRVVFQPNNKRRDSNIFRLCRVQWFFHKILRAFEMSDCMEIS